MDNTEKLLKLLTKAKDVLSGIVCEQGEEALKRYGGVGLLGAIDEALGVKPWDGVYHIVKYWRGKKTVYGVCTDKDDPTGSCVLTGMDTAENALSAVSAIIRPGEKAVIEP